MTKLYPARVALPLFLSQFAFGKPLQLTDEGLRKLGLAKLTQRAVVADHRAGSAGGAASSAAWKTVVRPDEDSREPPSEQDRRRYSIVSASSLSEELPSHGTTSSGVYGGAASAASAAGMTSSVTASGSRTFESPMQLAALPAGVTADKPASGGVAPAGQGTGIRRGWWDWIRNTKPAATGGVSLVGPAAAQKQAYERSVAAAAAGAGSTGGSGTPAPADADADEKERTEIEKAFSVPVEDAMSTPGAEVHQPPLHGQPASTEEMLTSTAGTQYRKSLRPTQEMLRSLKLNAGQNLITFSVTSAMQGTQEVAAFLYLWRPTAKVVVSDVDGTITRSDLLGNLMPLVGRDWSHSGVTHLYSNIQNNGFEFIYLTSRAIGQVVICCYIQIRAAPGH